METNQNEQQKLSAEQLREIEEKRISAPLDMDRVKAKRELAAVSNDQRLRNAGRRGAARAGGSADDAADHVCKWCGKSSEKLEVTEGVLKGQTVWHHAEPYEVCPGPPHTIAEPPPPPIDSTAAAKLSDIAYRAEVARIRDARINRRPFGERD